MYFSDGALGGIFLVVAMASGCLTSAALSQWIVPIRQRLSADVATRNLTLDGLRGVLATSVMCYHLVIARNLVNGGPWEAPHSAFATQLGHGAVVLFFMITGFLFWNRVLVSGPRMKWLSFAVGRVFRLVPLFYVLVAIMVVLGLAQGVTDWTTDPVELARRITGWLFFTIRTGPGFDSDETTWLIVGGVAWTLRYEWAFYLALPLAAAIFTKARSWPAAIASVLAIALLLRATRFYPLQPEHFRAFLGGIVTAYWIRSPRLKQIARSRLFGAAGLAAAVIVLCQYEMTRPDIIALLTLLFIGLTCENPLFKILCAAPLRWMGEISYGLYLLHGLFIWAGVYVFAPLVSGRPVSDLTVCLYVAAATPLLVGLATFLNIAVEQPGIDLGRRVASHRWRGGMTNSECRMSNAPSGVR